MRVRLMKNLRKGLQVLETFCVITTLCLSGYFYKHNDLSRASYWLVASAVIDIDEMMRFKKN